nr:hypothetical protein GCM10025732_33030 [Glycomyces mayteni]
MDDFDRIGADVPLLVNLRPAGKYLMDDLHRAGGFLAVLREVRDLLDPDALTVTGAPLVSYLDEARIWDEDVIAPRGEPLQKAAGIAVLRGSLAPGGALVKPSAASPHLLQHRGRALVFDSIEDFRDRIDDPDLDVDADTVLVLRGCGPKGYPGMPEVSNLPLPKKLLEQGVRDMVRICDGRMSGTAYGTVVLHVTPEAAAGGPWPWCGPATPSSSTSPPGASTSTSPRPNSPPARRAPPPSTGTPSPPAAGSASTSTTSPRPTPVPTSTSSRDRAARRSTANPTEPVRYPRR